MQSQKNHSSSRQCVARANLTLRLGLILMLGLAGVGCASFNSNMVSTPDRSGAPPYADDPEANGNPAKAWYN